VSPEKTRVVNVKRRYSDFLGFKIKVHKKSEKYVVKSHIADKSLKRIKQNLTNQAKNVAKPRTTEAQEISLFNTMVEGVQNYYCIATNVNLDCRSLNRTVTTILTNRLQTQKGTRLARKGRELTKHEKERYGKSAMLRYATSSNEPIYPIGYVQHKSPMAKKRSVNPYSAEGRNGIHDNLCINTALMRLMMEQPLNGRSVEYADNRISLFSAQWGKCAITGKEYTSLDSIHCHHITPRSKGGTDKYHNLVLVLSPVHRLIHATQESTITYYLKILNLNETQLVRVNEYREKAGNAKI
jgi:5-methylcytosine-specific restriction endonuclease McrA